MRCKLIKTILDTWMASFLEYIVGKDTVARLNYLFRGLGSIEPTEGSKSTYAITGHSSLSPMLLPGILLSF